MIGVARVECNVTAISRRKFHRNCGSAKTLQLVLSSIAEQAYDQNSSYSSSISRSSVRLLNLQDFPNIKHRERREGEG
jgi:hypothetical protein